MENQKKNEYDIQAAKSLGDELGQLRHKSGWDIDEVARRLKLSAEQIEALEKETILSFQDWSSLWAICVLMPAC